jgi:toxin YoeB
MREAVFRAEFLTDLGYWMKTDRAVAVKTIEMVQAVLEDPFHGTGKPEPLRFVLQGCWSRRITQEHRIVYRVERERVTCLQARYHY